MVEKSQELPLTPQEIDHIQRIVGPAALLVGGQALAFWANYYRIEPVGVLSGSISADIDFIGGATVARRLVKELRWTLWLPTPEDGAAQTAKLSETVADGIKQIDFLTGITGLPTAAVEKRAVRVQLDSDVSLRILHPLDVLESRLQNLRELPHKRTAQGIAQANLAIGVAGSFISDLIDHTKNWRDVLDAVERIFEVAQNKQLISTIVDYDLDVLSSVPIERIQIPEFSHRRWPQVTAQVVALQQRYRKRRRSSLSDPSSE